MTSQGIQETARQYLQQGKQHSGSVDTADADKRLPGRAFACRLTNPTMPASTGVANEELTETTLLGHPKPSWDISGDPHCTPPTNHNICCQHRGASRRTPPPQEPPQPPGAPPKAQNNASIPQGREQQQGNRATTPITHRKSTSSPKPGDG
jgi:hypothetical protein